MTEVRYSELLQKLALPKKKKNCSSALQASKVEGALVPRCGLRRGKSCNVRVSCWAVGGRAVAIVCCILLCWGAHGVSAPPRLMQSHASVYHRPSWLQAICLAAISQAPCANKDGPWLCELSFPEQDITNKATNRRRRNDLCAQLGGFRSSH